MIEKVKYFFIILFYFLFLSAFAQVEKPDYIKSRGFFILDGKTYNPDGSEFIMRGVNQNHYWGDEQINLNSITAIPNSHANIVRVVMSNADWQNQSRTAAKKRSLVEKYIAQDLIPMVELHDGTCESSPSFIEDITDSWTEPANVAWFNDYEEYVILNIANEWGPGDTDSDWRIWRDTYKASIGQIRDAGINNMIVIDSPKCGQGPRAMEAYGQELLDYDPQHNLVFSIHMYGWWRTREHQNDVNQPNNNNPPWLAEWELQTMLDLNLPVIVGEFSWTEASSVGYDTENLIAFCQQNGIGWLAWSWNGNGDNTLDMVNNWRYDSDNDLKEYGKLIINHPLYGLRATATMSTVFGVPNSRPAVTLDSPKNGDIFESETNITISANATDNDGTISKVVFYAGNEKLGETTSFPYSLKWLSVPRGRYEIYAAAWDDDGLIGTSDIIEIKIGYREISKNALFVTNDIDLRADDMVIKERLEILGYNVKVVDDAESTIEDTNDMDIVLISSSAVPTRVKSKFKDVDIPVIIWETSLFDDMSMTGSSFNNDYGRMTDFQIDILDSIHPIATGLSKSINIYTEEALIAWGKPAESAQVIASIKQDSNKAVLFVYEKGDQMMDMIAPAPRVGLYLQDNSADILTINGWKLFDKTIDYTQNTTVIVQKSGKNNDNFLLDQNYPNPFNPQTTIRFSLAQPENVTIIVYDLAGKKVKTLAHKYFPTGQHQIIWDGTDEKGKVASGLYFYRITAGTFDKTQSMLLIK